MDTTALDLPPALANVFGQGGGTQQPQAAGMQMPAMGQQMPPMQRGAGMAAQGQPAGTASPEMLNMEINRFANQHPEQVAQIQQVIAQLVQSGELTPQELNMVVQLATVAAQNPAMYPHIRKFAIQQGIATEQDIPPQYDAGLVFVLLLAAKAVQSGTGSGQPAQGVPSMATGGMVPNSQNQDGSVLVNAHENEYVVPANVVRMKGREFFDNLVAKYEAPQQ